MTPTARFADRCSIRSSATAATSMSPWARWSTTRPSGRPPTSSSAPRRRGTKSPTTCPSMKAMWGDRKARFGDTFPMMSPEQNELITRIGPGTKCGALMRHYWHPVALAEELDGPRAAKAVRVLGQDFVLFRDERGRHGLLDRHCAHRGADLAYGRLEGGGLRCLFHGWLFDTD